MFRLTLSNVWARKRRLFSASFAVVLGVAFLFATMAVADTMRSGFDTMFNEANAATDVLVRNSASIGAADTEQRGLLDASLGDELAAVDGVDSVVPAVEGIAQIIGADGEPIGGEGPPTFASNWLGDSALNPWTLAGGRAPQADGEVVIDRASARTGDLEVGDHTTVLTPAPVDVTVVGIATFGEVDSMGPTTWVAFDTATAQDLLVGTDQVSAFLVSSEPGVDADALRDAITPVLPEGAEALTGTQLTDEQLADIDSDFLGFVEVFLLVFAAVALLVATFSIHNTFTILVAQRTREAALLRAIGGTRRQVLLSTAGESLLVGTGASVIGMGVGVALGLGLRALLAGFGLDLPGSGLVVTTGTIVTSLVVGVLVTLVAGIVPAVRASRVAPLAALRDVAVDRAGSSVVRALVGAVLAVAGAAMTVRASSVDDGALSWAGLGALALVAGTVVLGPVVARPVIGLLGLPVARLRGEPGRLAVANAVRTPRRTAASASALLVGTTVVTLFTVLGASITASIDDTVDRSFGGDLVISQESFSGATLDPALAPALRELPEVAEAASIAVVPARVDGAELEPVAVDPAELSRVLDVGVLRGDFAGLQPGEIGVGEHEAEDRGWDLGTVVPVEFVDGATADMTVVAVYEEAALLGDVAMHVADWEPHRRTNGDVAVLVGFAPDADPQVALSSVTTVASDFGAPEPQTRDEYVESISAGIDQLLILVYGLLGLAVVIALMGIANALSLSIHERTREIGLLRAVGQTRRQVRATVRWESVLTAVFGTVGGLGLGVFLGWGLLRVVAAQEGLGVFALPVTPLIVILAVAVVAGTVAGLRPARRAARLDVVAALAAE